MPNNISIKTDFPRIRSIQATPGQFVGTATTYSDSTVAYSSATVRYGGHDGNDGPGPKIAKLIKDSGPNNADLVL